MVRLSVSSTTLDSVAFHSRDTNNPESFWITYNQPRACNTAYRDTRMGVHLAFVVSQRLGIVLPMFLQPVSADPRPYSFGLLSVFTPPVPQATDCNL